MNNFNASSTNDAEYSMALMKTNQLLISLIRDERNTHKSMICLPALPPLSP
jgi:hypothetical protein